MSGSTSDKAILQKKINLTSPANSKPDPAEPYICRSKLITSWCRGVICQDPFHSMMAGEVRPRLQPHVVPSVPTGHCGHHASHHCCFPTPSLLPTNQPRDLPHFYLHYFLHQLGLVISKKTTLSTTPTGAK